MIGKIAIGAAMLAMVAAVPARADEDKSGDKKEQMICKIDRATGSLIKTHKICMTKSQWRDYYAKTKDQVDNYSSRQGQSNGGAGQAEGERGPHAHAAGARMVDRTEQRGGADDQQGLGRRHLDRLAERVDEDRHGEDRAAAADEAEREADREPEREREQRGLHLRLLRERREPLPQPRADEVAELAERRVGDPVEDGRPLPPLRDDALALELVEVLRRVREPHVRALGELAHGQLVVRVQLVQEPQARGVGEEAEPLGRLLDQCVRHGHRPPCYLLFHSLVK